MTTFLKIFGIWVCLVALVCWCLHNFRWHDEDGDDAHLRG